MSLGEDILLFVQYVVGSQDFNMVMIMAWTCHSFIHLSFITNCVATGTIGTWKENNFSCVPTTLVIFFYFLMISV